MKKNACRGEVMEERRKEEVVNNRKREDEDHMKVEH